MNAAGDRVIRILAGQSHTNLEDIRERVIIIAHDLSPADAIQLQVGRTLGIVTEIGGSTSHTSIVARSLNIPAVVAAENAVRLISMGDILIIDGGTGTIIINPERERFTLLLRTSGRIEKLMSNRSPGMLICPQKPVTATGSSAEANIEVLEEVVSAKDNGAEAIGLYRTEFFFMNRLELPG